MPRKIVDACCLINLFAAGNTSEILRAFEGDLFVPDFVKGETLYIRQPDEEDGATLIPKPIDLAPALEDGLLHLCRIENQAESEEFVRFAGILEDGEAACLAIAKCRAWAVATDDRKALRVAAAEGVATVTTPELVKLWADSRKIGENVLRTVLHNIERFARFSPRRDAPLRGWWLRYVAR